MLWPVLVRLPVALLAAFAFVAAAAGLVADCAAETDGDSIVLTATAVPTTSENTGWVRINGARVGTEG